MQAVHVVSCGKTYPGTIAGMKRAIAHQRACKQCLFQQEQDLRWGLR